MAGRFASGAAPRQWPERRYASISGHMHRVVALLPPGVPPFELGIVTEVFGLARPELDVPWWYSLSVCTEHPGRRPASVGGFAFQIDHGLEALAGADTVIVPGWHGEMSSALLEA